MNNDLWFILGAVLVIVGLPILLSYLHSKGFTLSIMNVRKTIDFAKILINVLEINNLKKNKIELVLDIVNSTVDYVEKFNKELSPERKKQIALETSYKLLADLKIELTESEHKLVEMLIDEGLNFYNK